MEQVAEGRIPVLDSLGRREASAEWLADVEGEDGYRAVETLVKRARRRLGDYRTSQRYEDFLSAELALDAAAQAIRSLVY